MRRFVIASMIAATVMGLGVVAASRPAGEAAPRCHGPNPPARCPTATATATSTPTETPTPLPTPTLQPHDVRFIGPNSNPGLGCCAVPVSLGDVATYTLTVRNRGTESAVANLNYFGSRLISPEQPNVFTVLCVATGLSTGGETGCMSLEAFNAAGVNGTGFGGTILPGESAWASFTGYFNVATDQVPLLVEATWRYTGNGLTVSGNVVATTSVAP